MKRRRAAPEGGERADGVRAGPAFPERAELTREDFLVGAGVAGVGLYAAASPLAAPKAPPPEVGPVAPPGPAVPLTFTAWVRRRNDFLSLRFEFYNLKLDTSDPDNPVVRRKTANKASYLVAVFQPQHVTEEAFQEPLSGSETLKPPGDVKARLAGESRLSFAVPASAQIPYDAEGLLAWAAFQQHVVPVAKTTPPVSQRGTQPGRGKVVPRSRQPIRAPEDWETQLELPWRLVLSPNEKAGWAHRTEAFASGGRTELWHTRLGIRKQGGGELDFVDDGVDEADPQFRTVRAIWALDPNFAKNLQGTGPGPSATPIFPGALSEDDRHDIVRLTSDYVLESGYVPQPVEVNRMMLSALGGWLDSRGVWNAQTISLIEWQHRATLGRDQYVRTVRRGYILPFGHRAVKIQILERKVHYPFLGNPIAYLRRRVFLVIKQRDREYAAGAKTQQDGGRAFPFEHLRVTTVATPDLNTEQQFAPPVAKERAFMPKVGPGDGTPFLFHLVGTDWVGRHTEFTAPGVWVDEEVELDGDLPVVVDAYNAVGEDVRTGFFDGQSVALAASAKTGDTDAEVKRIVLGAQPPRNDAAPGDLANERPPVFPNMVEAKVRLAAAEQLSGGAVGPPDGTTIAYDEVFVADDYGDGGVFAKIVGSAPLQFPSDKSGGVMTPNIGISGLSRTLGTVGGDLAEVRNGSFNPEKIFAKGVAQLLGGLDLFDVIGPVNLLGGSPDEALKITTEAFPDRVETKLAWRPVLKPDPLEIFEPQPGASMTLDAALVTDVANPAESTFSIVGDLRDFKVNLVGTGAALFLILTFNQLRFTSASGQKSKTDVDIANVEFAGVLKFVQELSSLMDLGGGGGGPAIDITPTQITAGFAVPIPSIQVGVFGISNIKFLAGVTIPFTGKPVRVRFGFSERADPFQIQVSMFAGGGFFGLAIGADGVELVEAALEFGASISLDIGVASGGVYLMAGVYFSYGLNDDGVETTTLTGYVRMGGELCIIGLISLSLEFYMSLTYQNQGQYDKVIGQAKMTVTVEVLCFSADVTLSVERRFGNGPNDPTFADTLEPADWDAYADAFAEIPA